MNVRLYVVWGDVRDLDGWEAIAIDVDDHHPLLTLNVEEAWATVKVGPTTMSGPVASDLSTSPDLREVVVLVDDQAPDWVRSDVIEPWGWRRAYSLPALQRRPFMADVLLLSPNWADQFDGWSSLLWFDSTLRPLSRVGLHVGQSNSDSSPLPVRVLEAGNDQMGMPFAVVYCSDRKDVDSRDLLSRGWRSEPRSRTQRQTWRDLVTLSDMVEVQTIPLLGRAIISGAVIHVDKDLSPDLIALVPEDVQEVIAEAVRRDD